jgi:hypothetical protein
MGFTSIDTLIIRATGLVVAMFSGLISTGPFMRKGLADIKIVYFCSVPIAVGALGGAFSAVALSEHMGATGDAIVRLLLGLILIFIAAMFVLGGSKTEYPEVKHVDRFTRWVGLSSAYWEESLGRRVDYTATRSALGFVLFSVVGFTGGFFGLGGGWAVVPVLNLVMMVPLKISAAFRGSVDAGAGDWRYSGGAPSGTNQGGFREEDSHTAYRRYEHKAGAARYWGVVMKEVVWVAADPSVAEHIRPKVPRAGVVYGEVVYWFTVLGSVIAIVGSTIAMLGADNFLDPSYVFSAIWQGESTVEIWEGAVGQIPNGHWYLPRLGMGDALAMSGLALGVFAVIPAMVWSAIILFREGERLFGTLAAIAAILCVVSCLGLIRMPSGNQAETAGAAAGPAPAEVAHVTPGDGQR